MSQPIPGHDRLGHETLSIVADRDDDLVTVFVDDDVSGDEVVVTISDDGQGFVPEAIVPGYGLRQTLGRNLRAVGGSANVLSVPGHGTTIEIRLPRTIR